MTFRIFGLLFLVNIFIINSSFCQIITTIAGGSTGHAGYWGEGGLATASELSRAAYVCVDKYGDVYIADNDRVLKVDANTKTIVTVAGTGVLGFNGDNKLGTEAQVNGVGILSSDQLSGNIIFGDGGNYRIRKITKSTGFVTTVVGTGIGGSSGDGGLATAATTVGGGVCIDNLGNLYFSCERKIRKVNSTGVVLSIAGTGMPGYTGEGVLANTTNISYSVGLASDKFGNIYFSDSTGSIRKINVSTGVISRVAGTGDNIRTPYSGDNIQATSCNISPLGIAIDDTGNIYIADGVNHRIEKIDTFGIIRTIAGTGINGYSGDEDLATNAKVSFPQSVSLDKCGNVYIADFGNKRIRKVTFNPECLPLNVTDVNSEVKEIKVYPNPVLDELSVHSEEAIQEVALYNAVGQLVLHGAGGGQQSARLALGQLPAGVYMVRVNGQFVNRIVKQ